MKTFTLGVIAVILVVAVLDMAQGKPGHSKHAIAKHANSKLEHSKPAQGKAGHQRDSEDDEVKKCMEENGGVKCFDGCLYESLNITTNGEFNKDAYATYLRERDSDIEQDDATKAADECEAKLADFPTGYMCLRGLHVFHCILELPYKK